MKNLILLAIFALIISCTKKEEAPVEKPVEAPPINAVCEEHCADIDKNLCENLFKEYTACNDKKTEDACKGFLEAFKKVLPKTVECTNTCDPKMKYPSAITYQCDEIDKSDYPKITERSSQLLVKLKYKAAQTVLKSDEFYKILDGALAEEIMPEVQKANGVKPDKHSEE